MFGLGEFTSRLGRAVYVPVRTATKRASGGKSANNNTAGRRLGPKVGEGAPIAAGQIIWRQRGTKWYPGENAGIGRDHTIFAKEPGFVRYYRDPFHAKRRFIGVALLASDRLPTPHFEPRRRRLGFTVIDNEEVAAHEEAYLTRKETKYAAQLDQLKHQRKAAAASRATQFTEVLKSNGIQTPSKQQQAYLESIFQYMNGGMTYDQAKEVSASTLREDIEIAANGADVSGALDVHQKDLADVDNAVAFGPRGQLISKSEYTSEAHAAVVEKIKNLATPYLDKAEGTAKDVADEILAILSTSPVLSAKDVSVLKKQYLRRPSAIAVTPELKADLEKRAKKGEGRLQSVWDTASSSPRRYFVPAGAKRVYA